MAVDAELIRQFTIETCDLAAHRIGGQDDLDRARATSPYVAVLDPKAAPNVQRRTPLSWTSLTHA